MSTRSLGLAAYRRMIEAAPAAAIDGIDNKAVHFLARRAHVKDLRAASDWGTALSVPSKWYAVDGSARFYHFKKRKADFLPGWNCFGRIATSPFGDNAAAAYILHGGQITDRRPSGWVSAATLAGARFGGLDGGPRDWGWKDNEDLDLNIREVERLRAQSAGPNVRGHLSDYAEHLHSALVGV